jgi:hypothetical protein
VRVEIECEGRKCPHTQTQTHTFLFYLNKDGHRIIPPEAHLERQCEGERECEGRKCPHTQTHTHTFLFST